MKMIIGLSAAGAVLLAGLIAPTTMATTSLRAADPIARQWTAGRLVVSVTRSASGFVGTVTKDLRPSASWPASTCPRVVGDVVWKLSPTGSTTGDTPYSYTGQVLPKGSKEKPAAPTPPAKPTPTPPAGTTDPAKPPKPPKPSPTPEPTGPSDRASTCGTWHSASYSLDENASGATLAIVDHFGGTDTVSVWADVS